jgi:hypothetical protein
MKSCNYWDYDIGWVGSMQDNRRHIMIGQFCELPKLTCVY